MGNPFEYRGNRNLKKVGTQMEFTLDQIKEIEKCQHDVLYFIKNYVKIVHVDKGIIPFVPYAYQERMAESVVDNRYTICKLPRQAGKTTIIASILLWYALFNEQWNIAIIANKAPQAMEVLHRLQFAYESLPKWLQQGVVEWNKGSIELENGTRVLAAATTGDNIRGKSMNFVYIDEMAFINKNLQEAFFNSVYPTISSGDTTKIAITSTPNGMDLFYKIWTGAVEGNNGYSYIEINWWDTPGRDEKWKEETIKATSEQQFRVEFECQFLGSSNTLISGPVLQSLAYKKPIETNDDNTLKIYAQPSKERNYVITVDTGEGLGGDYSAFVVFDVTEVPYQVAAVFRSNKVSELVYPNMIYNVAHLYNEAMVLVEINSIGKQVANILYYELEYDAVLSVSSHGRKGQIVTSGFGSSSSQLGVRTTAVVKRVGCANLKTLVENQKIAIPDFDMISELCNFVAVRNSFEADVGYNDDTVMCLVLLAWLSTQEFFKEMHNHDIRKIIEGENAKRLKESVAPVLVIDNGIDDEDDQDPDLGPGWFRADSDKVGSWDFDFDF